MEHFVWLWLAIIVLAIISEVATEQLLFIWFVPGALVSAVFALCGIDIVWQVLVCVILAAIGIVIGRFILKKRRPKEDTRTNIDAIIGERCVVFEKIDNFAGQGLVKVKGQIWSARGVGEEDIFEVGEALTVVAIEGVKLICRKNV